MSMPGGYRFGIGQETLSQGLGGGSEDLVSGRIVRALILAFPCVIGSGSRALVLGISL